MSPLRTTPTRRPAKGVSRKPGLPGHMPSHSHPLISLQKAVGNQAVSRLVAEQGAGIQRKLEFDPKQLDKVRGAGEKLKGALVHDTFNSLQAVLSDYRKNKDPKSDAFYLEIVLGLCDHWRTKYGGSKSKTDQAKLVVIRRLESATEDALAEAKRDRTKVQAEEIYMKEAKGGKLSALDAVTKQFALPQAQGLAKGEKDDRTPGQKQDALDLAKKFNLTEAEMAAIKIYSSSDYVYINPATAASDSWMKQQTIDNPKSKNNDKSLKTLREQGGLHGGMMMKAFEKMGKQDGGKWAGPAFRGQRLSPKEFAERYQEGKEIKYTAFSSTSTKESAARAFANGTGGDTPPRADQTVSVMLYLALTDARDIEALSVIAGEGEVLLLPGATLVVESIQDDPKGGTLGSSAAPATEWKALTLKQIK